MMVEWKKLGEFSQQQKIRNKKHITENAYSITQNGLVPTKSFFKEKTNITSSDTKGYFIVEKNWFVYSPSRIDVGSINYLKDDGPVIVSPIDVVFSIDEKICLPSFLLSYFFTHDGKRDLLKNREGVEGTGRRSLPYDAIKSMLIPIPSLQEQERIVGILDTFTASIDNLKEQIAQRRKQYEHYRDQLLDLEGKPGVEWKKLGEICKIKTGKGITQKDCSHDAPYPVISGGQSPMGMYKEYNREANTTTISRVGAYAGYVSFITKRFYLNDKCFSIIPFENNIEPLYLYSVLKSKEEEIKNLQSEGGVPTINTQKLAKLLIPIPPLSEQQRIVSILDTFEDSIANLEAQLAERQKQYEYYRNRLLTFD